MSLITEIVRKHLLLEKKIAQIITNMDVKFNFEFFTGSHASSRKTRPEQGEEYNQREISNKELKFFIENFVKYQIAEGIINQSIINGRPFVIKSLKWELAFPVYPEHQEGSYWVMNIGTLWRESLTNPFRVSKNQFVIWVD
jgi:hypothetical protein